jgi:hypothetical protein
LQGDLVTVVGDLVGGEPCDRTSGHQHSAKMLGALDGLELVEDCVPVVAPGSGSAGYSSSGRVGRVGRVKREAHHRPGRPRRGRQLRPPATCPPGDSETSTLTLYATDRYRFAVRTLPWNDADLPDTSTVIPARALTDAAKATADDTTVDLALPTGSSGLFTLRSEHATTTIRALEGELPKFEALFPTEFAHTATVEIAALKAAAQLVALVSTKKDAPIRLTFTADSTLVLEGGTDDDAQAVDNVDTSLTGGALTIAFNPAYLLDGLNALTSESVQFDFTTSTKPAVLRGHGSDDQALRYLLMPIRLT